MNKDIIGFVIGLAISASGLYILSVINGHMALGVFLAILGNHIASD